MSMTNPTNNWLKAIVSGIFRHLRVELIPCWRLENYSFEIFLRKLFSTYAVDAVIDVGANQGQYHDFVRYQVGYSGWIVSFEPDPECVAKLRVRAKNDGKWRIEPVALGREHGHLELQVTADSHFNSFLHPKSEGLIAKQFEEKSRVTQRRLVEVCKLDDFEGLFSELGVNNPYLKLDTQGFDLEVLGGAASFLSIVCALQTEASVRAIYDGMPDYLETLDFLSKSGFAMSNTFPVSYDAAMRLVEFDCVAINSKLADVKLSAI